MSLVHTNPYYSVSQEDYTLPNGRTSTYYGIRGLQSVLIVPLFSDQRLGLIQQWRYLYNATITEFPAGRMNDNETAEQAAHRELTEETGWQASKLTAISWFAPCNGLTDEHCSVFLATGLTQLTQHLDATEVITTVTVTIAEFEAQIKNNQIQDGMTLAAWSLAKHFI